MENDQRATTEPPIIGHLGLAMDIPRSGFDLHLRMWVPGNLPPNLVFLIVVTARESRPADDSDSSYPIAADAPNETAHFQDRDGRQHAVDGETARLGDLVD